MKKGLITNINRGLSMTGLKLKKHSPEILIVTGVVGTVVSAVMACKATTKLDEVIASSKEELDKINDYVEENGYSEKYTEEDKKKDLVIVKTQAVINIAKLYGPSILVGVTSIGCILASHNIIRKRNLALSAAYTVVTQDFKDYRNRVIERFGKELDRELKYSIKAKEIEETTVDENGEETTVVKTVDVVTDENISPYAKFFDEYCLGWEKDSEYNLMFLKQTQSHANELLERQGYLFLNDVYDMLGIPRTRAGQVVGWIYDKKHPIGDNFVDFGIYNLYREKSRDFVNGYEKSILLDFNVDGEILQYI